MEPGPIPTIGEFLSGRDEVAMGALPAPDLFPLRADRPGALCDQVGHACVDRPTAPVAQVFQVREKGRGCSYTSVVGWDAAGLGRMAGKSP